MVFLGELGELGELLGRWLLGGVVIVLFYVDDFVKGT